jgi:glycosyltransferase involved in cell wall biosynthesis
MNICMVVYTMYKGDPRVRRAAEALSFIPEYNVRVLTLKEGNQARTYELDGVQVEELQISKYQGENKIPYFLSYAIFLLYTFLAVCRLFFQGKADVVHIHNMPNFLVFSALLPKLFGKKVILDVHDTMVETFGAKFEGQPDRLLNKILIIEEKVSYGFANRIICVNDIQKQKILERGVPEEKITTILNVPDEKYFPDGMSAARAEQDTFHLVYHGTVAKRLGIDLAINAVSLIKNRINHLQFLIMGAIEHLDQYKELARKLDVQEVVIFRGGEPVEQLAGILKDMDLGVIPNRRNVASDLMLPVKMLEYVALGIPVVAPRLKAIQYYFTDEMVYFYEPDSEEALAETILSAYGDKGGRIDKARNAKTFLDEYGWSKHKERLITLYKNL